MALPAMEWKPGDKGWVEKPGYWGHGPEDYTLCPAFCYLSAFGRHLRPKAMGPYPWTKLKPRSQVDLPSSLSLVSVPAH